jgi:hypothetical protein
MVRGGFGFWVQKEMGILRFKSYVLLKGFSGFEFLLL